MNNTYKIGGKYFYKVGGKFIPRYEGGGENEDFKTLFGIQKALNKAEDNMNEYDDSDYYHDKKTIGTMMGQIGNIFGSLANEKQIETPGERSGKMINSYQKTGVQKGIGAGLDTAAMLDPTGTMAVVNGLVKTGAGLSKIVNPGNKYGYSNSNVGEVFGSVLDPAKNIQQSVNVGKKHGVGAGLANFFTAGITGNNLMKKDISNAINADERQDMLLREGVDKGVYRNDSVYAQKGANIPVKKDSTSNGKPNIEIEHGEIFLGDTSKLGYYGDNTKLSNLSSGAVMFHGDKHGSDTNKDGMEGIPLDAPQGYIASNYLGVDGKKAKNNKTVAKEMKPYVQALSMAETESHDKYKSNPMAKTYYLQQLNKIKNEAEKNKFLENLSKDLNRKDRTYEQVMQNMMQSVPVQDLTSDEEQLTNQVLTTLNQVDSENSKPQMYNQYQQGGQNPSQQRMEQLMQQAPASGQQQAPQPEQQQGQVSPEQLQQIFSQLPPEVQQQIQQLPPEQQAQAIMQYAQQMQQQGQEEQMEAPSMEEQMAQGQMEGAEPQMACGGYTMNKRKNIMRMGGYY